MGIVEYGCHFLKLGFRGWCFEGGFLEPSGQIIDFGFGILAAANFVAEYHAQQETEATGYDR